MTLTLLVVMVLHADAAPPGYGEQVRPILLAAGCANGACHGSTLAPLKLIDRPVSELELRAEAEGAWATKAELVRKSLGELNHLGGKNLEPGSCEVQHLEAWLEGKTADCQLALRNRELPAPMVGPLPKQLDRVVASCATSSCHGGTAAPRLDAAATDAARLANADALRPFGNGYSPTTSTLFKVLQDGAKGHRVTWADVTVPGARALFGWMASESSKAPARLPKLATMRSEVMPLFNKRGCTQASCHGSVGSGLLLPPSEATMTDVYLRLLPRLADGSFWDKVTNTKAHGGGLTMAPKNDCVGEQVAAWIAGRALKKCPPRPAPSRELYASVVQPAFEQLKCTSCHKEGRGGFLLKDAHGDEATLDANYAAVQQFIDLDFPPVSHVLLRVREPCLQSRLVSWVAGRVQPTCEVKPK